eukprot:CAMPEP_0182534062 /NCGR_PEP_ID=MMETSP1323-20130603/14976_1 /TAXON_ID=236787 /ORGANISM="Florenciella parvula, Strain RCC1693" /LENGTH=237 /DNA_ID=CAMNT_0024744033 /DNA_START=50 /DNA_END=763 /DNA_ORIENTATION=+
MVAVSSYMVALATLLLPILSSEALVVAPRGRFPVARSATRQNGAVSSMEIKAPAAAASALAAALLLSATPAFAESDGGASNVENTKIMNGGASTIVNQRGARKTITRGVQLDKANFAGEDLTGVSFQQSQIRGGVFEKTKLLGASFFDATLDDSTFKDADMRQVNLEMASLVNADLTNAVITEAYVTGATSFKDAKIEGADFTDTFLRKDQQKELCATAKGTNPTTGVDTRDSLMCP